MGGAAGLLGGLGIGAVLFGAFKAGQAVTEGYGMAKDRDLSLDTLKRQMGDLGVSFTALKAMSDAASSGLGINSKEFAQLALQYNQASHGADRSPEDLASSVENSTKFSRAYGMDPGDGAGFFGGMKSIDPRQNNRELAVLIAEAINRSGGRALAADVMQAVQSFAAITSRISLSTPNVAGYADAYSSMLKGGGAGMTADNAAGILRQANSSMMGMGGAGEAGQNFIMQALNSGGGVLNPVAARALSAGGLFATRRSTFGSDTTYSKYMRSKGLDTAAMIGGLGDQTNFEAVRNKADRDYAGRPELEVDAMQRLFGLQSPQQAAALMSLDSKGMGGLNHALSSAGVDINSVNASSFSSLARIGGAQSRPELDSIYKEMSANTGRGSFTSGERKRLDDLQKTGSTKDFQDALVQITSSKDQAETDASKMRDGIKDLESTQISIGDKMIGPMNTMRDALLAIAGKDGKSATPEDLARRAYAAQRDEINTGAAGNSDQVSNDAAAQVGPLTKQKALIDLQIKNHGIGAKTGANLTGDVFAKSRNEVAELQAKSHQIADRIVAINKEKQGALERISAAQKASLAEVAKNEQAAKSSQAATAAALNANTAGGSVPGTQGTDVANGNWGLTGPVGGRQNNPFDLRPVGQSTGFQSFGDMQAGVTAGFRNLLFAQDGHHRNTLKQIISAYAPSSENDTKKYIDSVVSQTGYGADQQIDLHDRKVLKSVGNAMLNREGTAGNVTDDQLNKGVSAALGTQDTLTVNINLAQRTANGNGSTTVQNLQTSVPLARGSGATTTTLATH